METLARTLKQWRAVLGLIGIALVFSAYVALRYFNDALTPHTRALVLGLFVLAGWLFTPFIIYALILENSAKYSFSVTVYPRFVRIFTAYGWLFAICAITFVWLVLVAS